ncbi:MAG: serine/threonine protein kinase [Pseudoxanthomonas sp.]
MEPDDIKTAWHDLGEQLERHQAIQFQLLRERKLDRMQRSLRPLFWGQVLQMLLGVGMIVLGVACWQRNLHLPGYLIAGIVVHAYGVACIALGGITLGLIGTLDPAAPVLKIQKQLTTLRRFYAFNGMAVGLPWWVMWLPVVLAFAGLRDNPPQGSTPTWIWINLGVGLTGLLATWWFHRWSRSPKRPRLAKRMDDTVTGSSLRRAQAQLDELKSFEDD